MYALKILQIQNVTSFIVNKIKYINLMHSVKYCNFKEFFVMLVLL